MKIPVSALFDNCEMMLYDHWGYIWGTAGIMCTEIILNKAVNNPNNPSPEITEKYGKQWLGHMVTDCSGVMVYIWKQYGLSIPHGSNSMVRQGYVLDISPTPKAGYAAFVYKEDKKDYSHIGIVGEDGQTVYEARGTQSGFVTSKVTDPKWNRFGRFRDVDYEESGETLKPPYYATVTTNSGPLNVRSGPSTDYPKIGKVEKGKTVIVKTHNAEWDFINADGLQGYVSTVYLRPEKEVPDDPEPPKPDPSGNVITFTVSKEDAVKWIETLESISATLKAGGAKNGY